MTLTATDERVCTNAPGVSITAMNDLLTDSFRHNAWATRKLLSFCGELPQETLDSKAPGSYGSVQATLQHLLGAEAVYSSMFLGAFPAWDWREGAALETMASWEEDLAARWDEILSRPLDAEGLVSRPTTSGATRQARAGVVLAQTLHHGTLHREQVCATLTSLGLQPPDLEPWSYARTGR
jgi:uncharacterized damage-inducible protein DinB